MTSVPVYDRSNSDSKEFFKQFCNKFMDGFPIQLNWQEYSHEYELNGYVTDLYNFLEKNARKTGDFETFRNQYTLFKKSYDVHLRWSVYEKYVDFLIDYDKIEDAVVEWISLQEDESTRYRDGAIDRLMHFEQLLKYGIVNGYHIANMAPKSGQLTEFGNRNRAEVLQVIDVMIRATYRTSFFELFYEDFSLDSTGNLSTYAFDYYEQFFTHSSVARKTWDWYYSSSKGKGPGIPIRKDGSATSDFVKVAIRYKANSLLREGENEYRMKIGAKKVGESWISETELFYKLKNQLSDYDVIHHGRPDWLGRQHFDIWIPHFKCAIEFQGEQHDKPIDYFGGQEAFIQNQRRDELKRQKAILNSTRIIEVRSGYVLDDLVWDIKSGTGLTSSRKE